MSSEIPRATFVTVRTALTKLFFLSTIPEPSWSGLSPHRSSTEEHWTRARAVNLHMTGSAVGILRILVMLGTGRFDRANVVSQAVARKAKLIDRAKPKQSRI